MKPVFDFVLDRVVGVSEIVGRNCGVDLPLGHVFTAIGYRDWSDIRTSESPITPEITLDVEVSLQVTAMELYHRRVEIVYSGYGALLTLSGDEMQHIEHCIASAPEGRYYSLYSPATVPE